MTSVPITRSLPAPGPFWTFNREERNAVAVLFGLLARPGDLDTFARLLNWHPDDLADAEVSVSVEPPQPTRPAGRAPNGDPRRTPARERRRSGRLFDARVQHTLRSRSAPVGDLRAVTEQLECRPLRYHDW